MPVILKNNVDSALAQAVNASDPAIVVATGTGVRFPALAAGEYFYVTLVSAQGTREIVKVTSKSGDTLGIVRAQEGTTANSFAAGSRVEMRVTAASITDLVDEHDQASEIAFVPTGTVVATDVQGAIAEVNADVVALGADVVELEADVVTLEADVATLEASVSTLETDVVGLEADVVTLEAALGGAAFNNTYASTTAALSNGVISTTALVAGSGGTNGTFDVGFSGGSGTGAAARFTVSGGALVNITITNPGTGYTSAPTLSFSASSGLSGASATAVIGARQAVGTYFYVPGSGETSLFLYRVDAGPVATLVSTQPSSTAINVRAGTKSGWRDPFFAVYEIGETFLGRSRWFGATNTHTYVPSTVFAGGRALRRNTPSDTTGPLVWLDDIGVVPGNTITVRAILTSAGPSVRFGIRFRNDVGTSIAGQIDGNPLTSSANPTLVSVTTVVPTTAVSMRFYFFQTSGSGSFDCHALWVCKGAANTVPEWPTFGADLVGSELAQNIQTVQLPALTDRLELTENTDAYAFQTYGSVTPEPTPSDVVLTASSIISDTIYGSPFRGWGERYAPAGVSFNALRFRYIGRAGSVAAADYWRTLQVVVRASSGGNSSQSGSTLVAVGETLVQPNKAALEDVVVILRDPVTNAVKTLTDADLGTEYFVGTYMLDQSGGDAFCSPHRGTMTNVIGTPQSYYVTSTNPQTGNWATFTGNRRLGCDHLLLTTPQDVTVYAPTQQLINDIAGGSDTAGAPNSFNTEALRQYAAKVTSGGDITIAFLGDSLTNTAFRIVTPMRNYFAAEFGISAPGYISANTDISIFTNGTRSRAGTWTNVRSSTTAVGPDNSHTSATLSFGATTTVGKFFLHYLRQPNGGTFRYSVSGGPTTDVVTDGTLGYQVLEINGPGTLNITIVSAGSAGVLICGCDVRNTTAGQVVLHKLGSGGATAAHFAGMGSSYLEAAYQSIAPDIVAICLGTNDQAADVSLSGFRRDVSTIVERIRDTVPLTDVLLLAPGPNNTSASYPIADYATQLYDLAIELDCAFVDLGSGFGTYSEANARGMFSDAVHPTTAGGLVIGRTIWRAMFLE
jgi:lysophospholipase L1-like esterase